MTATRTLVIEEASEAASGAGRRGPWTLWALKVSDLDGNRIDERFKSFERLPVCEPIELVVERQEHPEHGVSYLLKRPRVGGGLGRRIEALERRVTALEAGTQAGGGR